MPLRTKAFLSRIQNNESPLGRGGGYEGLRDTDVKHLIIIIFIGSPSLMSSDCTRLIFKIMASCENRLESRERDLIYGRAKQA
jgi:hypothetical protein